MKTSMIKSLKNNHFVVFAGWDQLMQRAAREIGKKEFQYLGGVFWVNAANPVDFQSDTAYRLRPDYSPPEVKEPAANKFKPHECAEKCRNCDRTTRALCWASSSLEPEPPTLSQIAALLMSARSDIVVHGNYVAATSTLNLALDLVAKMEGGG